MVNLLLLSWNLVAIIHYIYLYVWVSSVSLGTLGYSCLMFCSRWYLINCSSGHIVESSGVWVLLWFFFGSEFAPKYIGLLFVLLILVSCYISSYELVLCDYFFLLPSVFAILYYYFFTMLWICRLFKNAFVCFSFIMRLVATFLRFFALIQLIIAFRLLVINLFILSYCVILCF